MSMVPAVTPVTSPVEEPIVAVPVRPATAQVPPGVELASVTVEPTHTVAGPVMEPTGGRGLTVKDAMEKHPVPTV